VVDTNRAGEAFASFLIQSLLDQGWSKTENYITSEMVQRAALGGSAAAGLTIQLPSFGFPSAQEVARVLQTGMIS
jgi:sugar/nucleoside kinase (ribokinase family)